MYTIDTRVSILESRIYKDGGCYKDRSAFIGSLVTHIINEVAYVTLLTGICDDDKCTWNAEIDKKFLSDLYAAGARSAEYEHKCKKVVRILYADDSEMVTD